MNTKKKNLFKDKICFERKEMFPVAPSEERLTFCVGLIRKCHLVVGTGSQKNLCYVQALRLESLAWGLGTEL